MIFWIACAIGVFYMLCEENNGILRWFAVFGAALGMIVYKESISDILVNILSTLIKYLFRIIRRIVRFLFGPLFFLGRKGRSVMGKCMRKSRKAEKYMKNKLTRQMKLLKITLCKQKEKDG